VTLLPLVGYSIWRWPPTRHSAVANTAAAVAQHHRDEHHHDGDVAEASASLGALDQLEESAVVHRALEEAARRNQRARARAHSDFDHAMAHGHAAPIMSEPPPVMVYSVFSLIAFVTSIAWLTLVANELVAVLQSLGISSAIAICSLVLIAHILITLHAGIILDISTAILGLTVLALGNSVGDLVADTSVAKEGNPPMGVASCFGSPLLNDLLGLGLSLTITCASQYPEPLRFTVPAQLKIGWAFLGTSLLTSLISFPLMKFVPRKRFLVPWMFTLYILFVILSVLSEVNVL